MSHGVERGVLVYLPVARQRDVVGSHLVSLLHGGTMYEETAAESPVWLEQPQAPDMQAYDASTKLEMPMRQASVQVRMTQA